MQISTALKLSENILANTSPTPLLDAEILLSHVLQVSRTYLHTHPEFILSPTQEEQFNYLIQQREKNIPIAYLTGKQAFWSFDLTVTPDTLIPRPETELLIELALTHCDKKNAVIADLGTGSGAIALAIAHEKPDWQVYATDISLPALEIAKKNAGNLKITQITFLNSDWFSALPSIQFDMIISNPPYIAIDDPHLKQGALPHEPQNALVSGKNGLKDIEHLICHAPNYLKKNAFLLLEHGYEQAQEIRELFSRSNYQDIKTYRDLAGLERVTGGKY